MQLIYHNNKQTLMILNINKMQIRGPLFILLIFSSCVEHFEEKEVYGYYMPFAYKNNFDTIQLQPHGVYHRKVYDINKKLLLEMKGKWKLEKKHRIILNGFYLNLDDDLVKFPHLVNDTAMSVNTYFETHSGTIQFCGMGHYPDDNCYRKIK